MPKVYCYRALRVKPATCVLQVLHTTITPQRASCFASTNALWWNVLSGSWTGHWAEWVATEDTASSRFHYVHAVSTWRSKTRSAAALDERDKHWCIWITQVIYIFCISLLSPDTFLYCFWIQIQIYLFKQEVWHTGHTRHWRMPNKYIKYRTV